MIIERDVRQIVSLVHVSEFERFVRLLAGRIGQLVNFDALSGEVGVSRTTIAGWMDMLELSMTYTPNFARSIKSLFGDNPAMRNPTVVYAGEAYPSWQGVRVVNYLDSCGVV